MTDAVCLLADSMSAGELLWFLVGGLCVVLATLTILALFCGAMGAVFRATARRASKPAQPAAAGETLTNEIPPELAAVIAAAVAVTIDGAHRIAHVGPATDDAWVHGRRFQHQTSHSVRHH